MGRAIDPRLMSGMNLHKLDSHNIIFHSSRRPKFAGHYISTGLLNPGSFNKPEIDFEEMPTNKPKSISSTFKSLPISKPTSISEQAGYVKSGQMVIQRKTRDLPTTGYVALNREIAIYNNYSTHDLTISDLQQHISQLKIIERMIEGLREGRFQCFWRSCIWKLIPTELNTLQKAVQEELHQVRMQLYLNNNQVRTHSEGRIQTGAAMLSTDRMPIPSSPAKDPVQNLLTGNERGSSSPMRLEEEDKLVPSSLMQSPMRHEEEDKPDPSSLMAKANDERIDDPLFKERPIRYYLLDLKMKAYMEKLRSRYPQHLLLTLHQSYSGLENNAYDKRTYMEQIAKLDEIHKCGIGFQFFDFTYSELEYIQKFYLTGYHSELAAIRKIRIEWACKNSNHLKDEIIAELKNYSQNFDKIRSEHPYDINMVHIFMLDHYRRLKEFSRNAHDLLCNRSKASGKVHCKDIELDAKTIKSHLEGNSIAYSNLIDTLGSQLYAKFPGFISHLDNHIANLGLLEREICKKYCPAGLPARSEGFPGIQFIPGRGRHLMHSRHGESRPMSNSLIGAQGPMNQESSRPNDMVPGTFDVLGFKKKLSRNRSYHKKMEDAEPDSHKRSPSVGAYHEGHDNSNYGMGRRLKPLSQMNSERYLPEEYKEDSD